MRITRVSSWACDIITPPSCEGFVVLSKVFVVRLHRVVSPHYWRGGSRWNLPSSRT